MDDERFPDFDGWTVSHHPARNEIRAVKAHPDAAHGRMVVRGHGVNLERVYLVVKRDALIEEARLSPGDTALAARVKRAEQAVVADKVRAGLAKGLGMEYAVKRLSAAGFTMAEMVPILDGATGA